MKFGARAVLLALLPSIAAAAASAGSLRTLYQFTGPEGGAATGGVIIGPSRVLYGETADGGTAPCTSKHGLAKDGCGTVYSLNPSGVLTVLASFHGANGAYGTSGLTLVGSTLVGATITFRGWLHCS